LEEILTKGSNDEVELIIDALQATLKRSNNPLRFTTNQGGADGERLTRAAFAVMIKYSNLTL